MLIDLRKVISRNADHCNKDLETMQKNWSKIDNSTAEIKAKLESMKRESDQNVFEEIMAKNVPNQRRKHGGSQTNELKQTHTKS